MIKHTIREIIDWVPIFFSPGDSHTKGMLYLLPLGLEGITEVATNPKRRFVSFKVTPSNDRVASPPSGYSTRERLAREALFWRTTKLYANKNEGNGNKIILGDLNCAIDKIDRDGENKTQILYRCCSNYALWKLIVDNGIEDLWKRETTDFPDFTCYDTSFAKDPG